ncbi:HAD-like domain-containing protein [Mycena galericulata]|nr:HAD-like domain-containing protein [Mycena galericulata]
MGDLIPESTLPYPPVYKDKRFVVLSDWDGTITTQDSNDYMTDNLGFGKEKRRAGNLEILSGRQTFRDGFREMLESITANGYSFDACKEVLRKNIKLDAGFADFDAWCRANDIPVVIVSSGMAPIIRAVLSKHVGDEEANRIDIIANEVEVEPSGKWHIKFRHPSSGYGHDKSRAILPYKDLESPPLLFFFGDGVSDMSAARHADVLFVKQKDDGENDLAAYCTREGIKHIIFRDFAQALKVVQVVVSGEKTPQEVLAVGKA